MNFNDFTKRLDPDYIPSITESIDLEEENVPTNPELWSRAKALAKKKFDVYPSAYANGWAAKWYKSKGGSWKKEESVEIEEKREVGRKVPELSSDARDVLAHAINMSRKGVPGMDIPLATGRNSGKFKDSVIIDALTYLRKNSSKMTPMGKKYAKEIIKVLGESVELDESLLDALKKKLSDEGGAAGFKDLEAVAKKMGMDLTPEKLKKMPGIMQHRDGDFILEGFASDAQRRAAFASGYKAKGKKGKKEEVEVDEASEKQMMDMLRKEYGKINRIDPTSPTYKKLTDMLDRLAKSSPQLLKKIADAKIKFVSPLALNRVNRMEMKKEDVQLDEMSAKAHYNKMVAQGKVGGRVVSPIDRKRFPNREREGMEGPYRVKRSGLIYYYDKKAGKYYDPQSDMYLDVKDVMEAKGTYSSDSRQSGEEKPLIAWMDKFEKALKSMGSSYAKVDPVEALKLYYKNVDPKRAASQLK